MCNLVKCAVKTVYDQEQSRKLGMLGMLGIFVVDEFSDQDFA